MQKVTLTDEQRKDALEYLAAYDLAVENRYRPEYTSLLTKATNLWSAGRRKYGYVEFQGIVYDVRSEELAKLKA